MIWNHKKRLRPVSSLVKSECNDVNSSGCFCAQRHRKKKLNSQYYSEPILKISQHKYKKYINILYKYENIYN